MSSQAFQAQMQAKASNSYCVSTSYLCSFENIATSEKSDYKFK